MLLAVYIIGADKKKQSRRCGGFSPKRGRVKEASSTSPRDGRERGNRWVLVNQELQHGLG